MSGARLLGDHKTHARVVRACVHTHMIYVFYGLSVWVLRLAARGHERERESEREIERDVSPIDYPRR